MSDLYRVTIAIPSYRRPLGLARLLSALQGQLLPSSIQARIVVFDNCSERSALPALGAAAGKLHISYVHVPDRGLSTVRNAALDHVLGLGDDYIAFIDDDEWPGPLWLASHVRNLRRHGASASVGSVRPVFTGHAPGWLTRRAARLPKRIEDGQEVEGHSSNIVFALGPVMRHQLRFHPSFDMSGGEDTAFFAAYAATGARIVHCTAATVSEEVPDHRASLSWHWRRWRRTGQTNARLRRASLDRPISSVRCAASGLARVGVGAAIAVAGVLLTPVTSRCRWDDGVRIAARGFGYIDIARGWITLEYAAPERADTPNATIRKSEISCGR